MRLMPPQETPNPVSPATASSAFTERDVADILRERGWLPGEASPAQSAWCERAAALLGPQASDRRSLAELLHLVFHYDAHEILAKIETHTALSRYAAREVVRHLALLLLDGTPLTQERFKEVVNALKDGLGIRSRELFHPIRLALTGRVGEGELDRVILLLDEAAAASFAAPMKSARERIVEFCAALD
jgi:nondiscriminating glutamyl-tRNA synthetase